MLSKADANSGDIVDVTIEESSTEPTQIDESSTVPPVLNWQDQDERLREMWELNQPPAVIAGRLGRSVAAIMTRAARLGLPRRTAPGRKPGHRFERGTPSTTTQQARAKSKSNFAKPVSNNESASSQTVLRVCLMCLNKFPSQGRHNRICPACKDSAEYVTGSSIPDISFRVET